MRARSRRVAVIVLVLVLALLSSGCFQIRMFKINGRMSLPPGLSTAVQLDLYPMGLNAAFGDVSRVVILVGLQDLNYRSMSSWDLAGNWGGPLSNSRNDVLRNVLLAGGNCAANGIDADDMEASYDEWFAYTSNDPVDSTGLTWADLANVFRLRLRVEREAGTADDGVGNVVVFAGFWLDDGDGVAEVGETFCNSMVAFSIPFRGA